MTPGRRSYVYLPALVAGTAMLYAWPLAAAESGKSGGLPQLDVSFFPGQLFWLALTFGILYLLMTYVALPGVRRTQDNRQGTIASELAAAKAANEQAKAMIAQYEKALADARSNAQTTVNEIKLVAAKESAERQAVQEKELSKRMHEAEAKIAAARDAAIGDVRKTAADLSTVIVERMSGLKLAPVSSEAN